MKTFPPAAERMTRHILHLPKTAAESDFKIELLVGT